VYRAAQCFAIKYYSGIISKLFVLSLQISGDPDLYISTSIERPGEGAGNYTWKSFSYGSDLVHIDPSTDADACTGCTYYIAVVGNRESTYSISVTLQDTMQALVDGVPQSGGVGAYEWQYYEFFLVEGDTPKDVKVTLTSFDGNADLYITMGKCMLL
jgi:hypothetical protein